MTLVYACIAPHGGEIIPELAKSKRASNLFSKTREGMYELQKQMKIIRPDTIVVATPHNLRLWKKIAIAFSENSTGYLESESGAGQIVRLSAKCDVKLAREIYSSAIQAHLPVVGANYGTFEGAYSDLPMDWGALIPLYFLLGKNSDCRIVIVSPSREISFGRNFSFGKIIGKIAREKKEKKVAFVASADQAHTHDKSGPYGFHPAAKVFDNLAVDAIESYRLGRLFRLDPRFIEDAKPDSPWQLAMLAGCLSGMKIRSRLISYDVPTYYGMICADFTPI